MTLMEIYERPALMGSVSRGLLDRSKRPPDPVGTGTYHNSRPPRLPPPSAPPPSAGGRIRRLPKWHDCPTWLTDAVGWRRACEEVAGVLGETID